MYDFYDLKPRNEPVQQVLPTDAICYNGHWLDTEINGFKTLTVAGRESLSRQINAPDSSGDGAIYLNSKLESRKIEIEFELKTTTTDEFNSSTERLKAILSVPNVKVVFNDDKSFHYVGSVVSLELEKPLLITKGKMEIECPDPYKYSDVKTLQIANQYGPINDTDIMYPQKPKTIEIICNDLTNVSVSCMGKKITLNESVSKGSKVVFDFDNLQVKVNEVSRLMSLDLSSNFSDFTIMNGAPISFPSSSSRKITYEVKRL